MLRPVDERPHELAVAEMRAPMAKVACNRDRGEAHEGNLRVSIVLA